MHEIEFLNKFLVVPGCCPLPCIPANKPPGTTNTIWFLASANASFGYDVDTTRSKMLLKEYALASKLMRSTISLTWPLKASWGKHSVHSKGSLQHILYLGTRERDQVVGQQRLDYTCWCFGVLEQNSPTMVCRDGNIHNIMPDKTYAFEKSANHIFTCWTCSSVSMLPTACLVLVLINCQPFPWSRRAQFADFTWLKACGARNPNPNTIGYSSQGVGGGMALLNCAALLQGPPVTGVTSSDRELCREQTISKHLQSSPIYNILLIHTCGPQTVLSVTRRLLEGSISFLELRRMRIIMVHGCSNISLPCLDEADPRLILKSFQSINVASK